MRAILSKVALSLVALGLLNCSDESGASGGTSGQGAGGASAVSGGASGAQAASAGPGGSGGGGATAAGTGSGGDASGAGGTAAGASPGRPPCAATTLEEAGACTGRLIGTALAAQHLAEAAYVEKAREFNYVTPENEMKWSETEPNRNQFTFGQADQIVNFAMQNPARPVRAMHLRGAGAGRRETPR